MWWWPLPLEDCILLHFIYAFVFSRLNRLWMAEAWIWNAVQFPEAGIRDNFEFEEYFNQIKSTNAIRVNLICMKSITINQKHSRTRIFFLSSISLSFIDFVNLIDLILMQTFGRKPIENTRSIEHCCFRLIWQRFWITFLMI